MRKGAATHGLVQDRNKEHVAVFEIRFHLVNGLNPKNRIEHNINPLQAELRGTGTHSKSFSSNRMKALTSRHQIQLAICLRR